MKSKVIYIFWGIVFVLVGGLMLAGTIDVEHLRSRPSSGYSPLPAPLSF